MLAIIQARLSSKRLPNKLLKKVKDTCIIDKVINRVKNSKLISNIIVATSDTSDDDELIIHCKKKRIDTFRGSLNNVAERLCLAAKSLNQSSFVRINGDSPLIDPKIIDEAIEVYTKKSGYDLVTNVFERTFPKGQSVEIINTEILDHALNHLKNKKHLEHVTTYFYENPKNFKIFSIKNKKNLSHIQLSIDTLKDFENLKSVMINSKMNNARWFDIVKFLNYT